jgi:GNAT superfamily N-acetyltransferase
MGTTLLDVHDDERTRQAYEAFAASKAVGRPWFEPPSYDETLVDWRHDDPAEQKEIWVVVDDGLDGRVVGLATMWLPMEDNTSRTWFDLQVHPQDRRRGHGSELMERIVERARANGRTELITDLMVPRDKPDHPYRRFMDKHGYSLNNTEIIRHLELPVADDLLDRLDAANRDSWVGPYRLETHVGGCPRHCASRCARS